MNKTLLTTLTALLACSVLMTAPAESQTERRLVLFPANGATNVNPDTQLWVTFPAPQPLKQSGQIRVYDASNDKVVDTLDLSLPPGPTASATGPNAPYAPTPYVYEGQRKTNANTVPGTPSGAAAATPRTFQLSIIGGFTDGFHFNPVIVRDRTWKIQLHHNLLEYNKTYYVKVEIDGVRISDKTWSFTTKRTQPAADATRFFVSQDGSGDFNTVQGALDFVPDKPRQRVTVFIRNGEYEEIVYFRNKTNLTLLGEDREKVVVSYANNEVFNPHPSNVSTNEWPGTFPSRRAVFMVDNSSGLELVNFTIQNTTRGQAEGLLVMGDRNILNRMTVIGSGDALQVNGSIYIVDSRIVGDGDTILGRGPAFFNRCVLESQGVFMWVRNTAENHGNVFLDSTFKKRGGGTTEIARAPINNGRAYPNAEAVLINAKLDGISPVGWGAMGGDTTNMHFWEYNSTNLSDGKPVDVSRRKPESRQLTMEKDAEIIRNYSDPKYVLGWTAEGARP